MKISQENTEFEMGNAAIDSNNFSIASNSMAFKVLSEQLYSDKITAVMREISCNAWDAQVASGKNNIPFDVQLPSWIEPVFRVRDYGTGLDHNDVMKIYTTYFDSTKRNTNEQIGGLGLGSKSPFAYTDKFTVASYFNGKKRTYSAVIGTNGSPSISLIHTIDTSEPNGLEVTISVNKGDIPQFVEKAKKVFFVFNPVPNIHGNDDFSFEKIEYEYEHDNFKIRKLDKNKYYYRNNINANIIMGNVVYPIDTTKFPNSINEKQKTIMNLPIDIIMPIGSITPSPSRETISYDEHTTKNIINMINNIHNHLMSFFEDKFNNCASLWEVMSLKNTMLNNVFEPFIKTNTFKYKDKNIPCSEGFDIDISKHENIKVSLYSDRDYTSRADKMWKGKTIYSRYKDRMIYITPHEKTILVFDDSNIRFAKSKILDYFKDNRDIKKMYLIEVAKIKDDKNKRDFQQEKDAIDKFMNSIGNPPVIFASKIIDLSKINITKTNTSRSPSIKVNSWIFNSRNIDSNNVRNCWKQADVNVNDSKGFYVEVANRVPLYKDNRKHDFTIIVEHAIHLNIIGYDDLIVGVNKEEINKYKNNKNWVNLLEFIENHVNDFVNSNQFTLSLIANKEIERVTQNRIMFIGYDVLKGVKEQLRSMYKYEINELNDFIEGYELHKNNILTSHHYWNMLRDCFDIKSPIDVDVCTLNEIYLNLMEKYKSAFYCIFHTYDKDVKKEQYKNTCRVIYCIDNEHKWSC